MKKKTTRILLTILHICLFSLTAILIYWGMDARAQHSIYSLSSQTITLTEAETETADPFEPESEEPAETQTPEEPASEPQTETPDEPQPELSGENTEPLGYFVYERTHKGMNIREAPSLSAAVIGSVPCGGAGNILAYENDAWALIEYNGTVGYCSRNLITAVGDFGNLEQE